MSSVLYGTKRIAAYLSKDSDHALTARQVGYLIEQDRLPTFKMGVVHCTTPDMLAEHFSEQAKRNGG